MGWPFDDPTWDGVSGAIYMGLGTALPGVFSVIAIGLCIAALAYGQAQEAASYKKYK